VEIDSEWQPLPEHPSQPVARYLSREGRLPPGWGVALPSIATRKHVSLPRALFRNRCGRFGQQ